MDPPSPLPKRIAWFAPWTWKRRWWVLALIALLTIYMLSTGPMLAFAAGTNDWTTNALVTIIYYPILVIADCSPAFKELLRWYWFLFYTDE